MMKKSIFVLLALAACVAAYEVKILSEDQWNDFVNNERKCLAKQ